VAGAVRSPDWATSRSFLDRLGLYARELPFIAVPILLGGALQGVLAVQPDEPDDGLLDERVTLSSCWPTSSGRVSGLLSKSRRKAVARPGT
jgi:hypothetical protein